MFAWPFTTGQGRCGAGRAKPSTPSRNPICFCPSLVFGAFLTHQAILQVKTQSAFELLCASSPAAGRQCTKSSSGWAELIIQVYPVKFPPPGVSRATCVYQVPLLRHLARPKAFPPRACAMRTFPPHRSSLPPVPRKYNMWTTYEVADYTICFFVTGQQNGRPA